MKTSLQMRIQFSQGCFGVSAWSAQFTRFMQLLVLSFPLGYKGTSVRAPLRISYVRPLPWTRIRATGHNCQSF